MCEPKVRPDGLGLPPFLVVFAIVRKDPLRQISENRPALLSPMRLDFLLLDLTTFLIVIKVADGPLLAGLVDSILQ
jgi:hypothetical protein